MHGETTSTASADKRAAIPKEVKFETVYKYIRMHGETTSTASADKKAAIHTK